MGTTAQALIPRSLCPAVGRVGWGDNNEILCTELNSNNILVADGPQDIGPINDRSNSVMPKREQKQ